MESCCLNVKSYSEYKDSGVDWLGKVPAHWKLTRFKYLFKEINERSPFGSEDLLSVSQYMGVTLKKDNVDDGDLLTNAVTLEGYKKVFKGDLVSNIMLAWNGSLGFSPFEGITSPAYCVYRLVADGDFRYFHYLLRTDIYKSVFKRNSSGVIESRLRLYTDDFFRIISLVPTPSEQTAIANFLNKKTAQIDKAIAQKERLIELLKERKQILIHKAVTWGLNPDAKMKNSGVEWIGEVPEHWEVKRVKHLLRERNERSVDGTEPLFMVSQVHGLVIRADYHEKAEVAASTEGSKLVSENDLVFNKLKAHLGVFFKSTIPFKGLVSPDYAVYYSTGLIQDLKFLELLFRTPSYITQFVTRATGIVEGLIRLYTWDLFDIAVAVPPTSEQLEILQFIAKNSSKIQDAISIKEQEIEKLKEYKSTLINAAVTGKIKVPE